VASRTATASSTSSARAPSADGNAVEHADFSFEDLVAAYFDCRRTKRNSHSALAFEQDLERNLICLHDELRRSNVVNGAWSGAGVTKIRDEWTNMIHTERALRAMAEKG
jgi:hypothetical protein